MKKTKWLILGATFLGCSFAVLKNDCVILEEGCNIGNEFVSAFNQKKPIPFNLKTSKANSFLNSLKEDGLVTESGEIYSQPAVFKLASLLVKNETEIHFDTVVLEIKKQNNGFLVEYSNCDGLSTIFAENILDTTSVGTILKHDRKAYLSVAAENGEITNEITKMSYFFVEYEKDFITTRKSAYKKAKKNNFKVIMTADRLCYLNEIKPFCHDSINYAPSDGFYNLIYAFEGGVLLAEEL